MRSNVCASGEIRCDLPPAIDGKRGAVVVILHSLMG
jgi:hypothetical protein